MRYSLRYKVFGGYLLFVLIAVCANLYIVYQLRGVSRITANMERIEVPKITMIKDISDLWEKKKRIEVLFFTLRGPGALEQYARIRQQIHGRLDRLFTTASSDAEERKVVGLKTLMEKYELLFSLREIEEHRDAPPEQVALRDEALQNLHERMGGELDALLDIVEAKVERDRQRTMDVYSRTAQLVVVLAVFILIAGILLASALAVGTTRSLRELTAKINVIARGNFKEHVDIASRDEVGELARAFNNMSAQLARLDEMKADFISHASHELRTPVAAIKNATSLFHDITTQELSDDQRKLLTIIAENATRLSNLINDLLDTAKLEAGRMELDLGPGDLQPLLEMCLDALSPLALEKRVTLAKRFYGRAHRVTMDGEKIEQVVTNLISNAIKFTPSGGRITVEAEDTGGAVEVRVIDTGCGIPSDRLTSVFDKFQQVKGGRQSPTRGTGLGLTISRYIVEAHGGRIWADSEPDRGSTFFFTIPKRRHDGAGIGSDH